MSPEGVLDLPLNAGGGRSAESFIFLAPGTTGNTFDAHINGSQTLSKEIQLDGLSMTIAEVGGDPRVLTLPPDAMQEMSIATGSYSAEFGNSGGGVERPRSDLAPTIFTGMLMNSCATTCLTHAISIKLHLAVNRQMSTGAALAVRLSRTRPFSFST